MPSRPLYRRKLFWLGTLAIFLVTGIVRFITEDSLSDQEEEHEPQKAQEIPASHISSKIVITGKLGVPVGETVTIIGQKFRHGLSANLFQVSKIDGREINTYVEIPGIEDWPYDTEATLRGAEIGTLRILTLSDTNFPWGGGDSRWKGPYQHLFLTFKVDSILSPENLELKKRRLQD